MEKKKLYLIIGGGLLVLIILIAIIYQRSKPSTNPSIAVVNSTSTPPVATTTVGKTTTSTTSTAKTTPKPPAKKTTGTKPSSGVSAPASQTYTDLLKTYQKSGFYIQIYPCQATPGSLVVKKGTKVMFDNRDSVSHVIGIGSQRYTVKAYGYAIPTFNTVGTNYVTCDGGGTATVQVQP